MRQPWVYGAFSIDMNRLWRIFQVSINMLQIFLIQNSGS
jgi:hypothetical protein